MLTPEDLAAYRAREGGKDKLTDAVIEAAEAYLWLRANAWRVRGVYLDEEVRAAMRAEKGEGNE